MLHSPGWRLVEGETYFEAGGFRKEMGVFVRGDRFVRGDSTPLVDILI